MKNFDEKTISAFLNHYKMVDIIKESGLSKNTCYKLRADPNFQQVLRERKDAMVKASLERMRSYLLRDIEELQAVIENSEASPQVRVNAIQIMLSQFRDWLTTNDLLERVEMLERREKDDYGTF